MPRRFTATRREGRAFSTINSLEQRIRTLPLRSVPPTVSGAGDLGGYAPRLVNLSVAFEGKNQSEARFSCSSFSHARAVQRVRARSNSPSRDHRRRPDAFFTAIATAFF